MKCSNESAGSLPAEAGPWDEHGGPTTGDWRTPSVSRPGPWQTLQDCRRSSPTGDTQSVTWHAGGA